MKHQIGIEVTNYSIQIKKLPVSFEGFKILQLSDLHSRVFNKNNETLVELIDSMKPNIILMTGDMMNGKKDNGIVCVNLVKRLIHKYPIYYILGNHEQRVKSNTSNIYFNYITELNKLGTKILDNSKVSILKGKDKINIYGLTIELSYYWGDNENENRKEFINNDYIEEKLGVCEKGEINVLLSHNPKYFEAYTEWGADLVFSGHVHGGIIRIPYLGGLLSPDRKFFPKYDWGIYKDKECNIVVSRGIGNSNINLRINNMPEIVMVTLKKGRNYCEKLGKN
ncbi:metallophosphoesterase [Clostridium sediminicola]|uniref:metallophosphoesterase n=1 Tax=Clostridium sediminicola TaxID=3114879 RepID=UPI0031F1D3C3